ncbi:MAG TPA: hypothetical protein VFZ79_08785 [Acidimicrobiales bacterium]
MHLSKNDLPVKVEAPGAVARQLPDFGVASGPIGAEHFTMAAGTDLAPLLVGLEDDACQSAHWGYLIRGVVVVTYTDGTDETCAGGEVVHWPAGHTVRVEEDADLILFSPQADHGPVLDHLASQLANA